MGNYHVPGEAITLTRSTLIIHFTYPPTPTTSPTRVLQD